MTPERARELAAKLAELAWAPKNRGGIITDLRDAILAAVEEDRASRVALPDADRERLAAIRGSFAATPADILWLLDLAGNLSAVLRDLLQDRGIDLLIAAAVRRERERCARLVTEHDDIPAYEWGRRYDGLGLIEAIEDG